MMVDDIIDRFAAQAPVAVIFRSLFARIFSDQALDAVFSHYREHQVESPVLFSHLVKMLVPVVSGGSKSVNASYQAGEYEYSRQAVYDKLKGIEPKVSAGLLKATVSQLRQIQDATRIRRPDPIAGFHTFIIDGKTYNATEHRLLESRTDARAPLPGRAVVLLDTRYEMFVDVQCDANAHRCERKILEPLLDHFVPGALYIADRNFSDSPTISGLIDAKTFFIVRQNKGCLSWRKIPGESCRKRGTDSKGGKVSEEKIEAKLTDGSWHRLRRITIKLKTATRDGDKEINLLSNLAGSVSAKKIADAYRQRWTIETCFGHLSRALNAEIKSLCYPGAAGLCFCLAMVLFNLMSTIKALVLKRGQPSARYEVSDLSYYYLADEVLRCHTGLEIAVDSDYWECYGEMNQREFIAFLKGVASQAKLARYRKHVRGPTKPRPKRSYDGSRHVATQKLLDARI